MILITGVTGMVGSHLADLLIKDQQILGLCRWRSSTENIKHLNLNYENKLKKSSLNIINGDITDYKFINDLLKEYQPEEIYHLAAQSFVPESFSSPFATMQTNIMGTMNILESVKQCCPVTKTFIAGSSEQYGTRTNQIDNDNCLNPMSPYAVSKVTCEYLAKYYDQYSKIVFTRAFNHEGPRRNRAFVTSSFARQIALMEKGKQEEILYVGNLNSQRDWTDVRDMVVAYSLAMKNYENLKKQHMNIGLNISSDTCVSVEIMLKMLLNMTTVTPKIVVAERRLRTSDVTKLHGRSSQFRTMTGWEPKIGLEETLKDTLNYWRRKIEKE